MYKVCKTFRVPIGHRLSKHVGLCKNIHGHNLKIQIELFSHTLNENDMVIDFGDLKHYIEDFLSKYDHTTIFNPNDKENIIFFKSQGYRIEFLSIEDQDPTAEVLSKYIFDKLRTAFKGCGISFVRVWENDNSYAEYSE
jgi:6-pyruvoyltetrahydropterin/6-carboxytetrahydropterin synthase